MLRARKHNGKEHHRARNEAAREEFGSVSAWRQITVTHGGERNLKGREWKAIEYEKR